MRVRRPDQYCINIGVVEREKCPLNRQHIKHYGRAVDQLTIISLNFISSIHNSGDGSQMI